MFKLWIALFIIFVIYTCLVYNYCDKTQNFDTNPDKLVLAGWHTWQEKNCQTCHQIYGLGGYLGPDLTNISSDPVKNDLYMTAFIKYGTAKMPNFHLNDSEVTGLVAYLKWVGKSGKSKVPKEKVSWTGNYNL